MRQEERLQRTCQAITSPADELAPLWHLRVLLCVLLLAPVVGLLSDGAFELALTPSSQIGALYAPLLLANAGFALYVSGVGLGSNKLRELLGRLALRDVLLGLALGAALLGVDSALQALSGSAESLAGHALVPQSLGAKLCWLPLAFSTAFSEELVYRGYLRRQVEHRSGSATWGIVVQALLFGIAHGPQGPSAVVRFSCYAALLGVVAQRRRGLLSVVVCHGAVDLYAGWAA